MTTVFLRTKETWWVLVVGIFVPWAAWSYYFRERTAVNAAFRIPARASRTER